MGIVAGAPGATQDTQSRTVTCGGKAYVVRRFADGIFAVYDESGRLLAGWPLTAFWPNQPLSDKTDEEWCGLIRGIYSQR